MGIEAWTGILIPFFVHFLGGVVFFIKNTMKDQVREL